eukprot:Awhi_evm1s2678
MKSINSALESRILDLLVALERKAIDERDPSLRNESPMTPRNRQTSRNHLNQRHRSSAPTTVHLNATIGAAATAAENFGLSTRSTNVTPEHNADPSSFSGATKNTLGKGKSTSETTLPSPLARGGTPSPSSRSTSGSFPSSSIIKEEKHRFCKQKKDL